MTMTKTKFAAYGWLITKDNLAEEGDDTWEGVVGPGGKPPHAMAAMFDEFYPIDPDIEKQLRAGEGHEFRLRMLDMDEGMTVEDDTVLHGRWLATDGPPNGSEHPLGPLDDIGEALGAVAIEYRLGSKWEQI